MNIRSDTMLAERTGEELLMLAIQGRPELRRRIDQELNLRALLAECRRRDDLDGHPHLCLVGIEGRAA